MSDHTHVLITGYDADGFYGLRSEMVPRDRNADGLTETAAKLVTEMLSDLASGNYVRWNRGAIDRAHAAFPATFAPEPVVRYKRTGEHRPPKPGEDYEDFGIGAAPLRRSDVDDGSHWSPHWILIRVVTP